MIIRNWEKKGRLIWMEETITDMDMAASSLEK